MRKEQNIFCDTAHHKLPSGHQPSDMVHLSLVHPVKVVERGSGDRDRDDHAAYDDGMRNSELADGVDGAEKLLFQFIYG